MNTRNAMEKFPDSAKPTMSDDAPDSHRPLRSFLFRQGRVSPARTRAHEMLMPVYGVPFTPHPIDLNALFNRTAPKILEIGFGMGDTTAAIAAKHPELDFLCLEVHTPGVG